MEGTEPRTDPSKEQKTAGCSGQGVFHYFFGQQASEVWEQWLHLLLEEWGTESAVFSFGETSQRVDFGRSVWSDSVTMSSRLLPGANHQLEPACQGDAHSPSPDMCREDPKTPTPKTATSSPRGYTEAQTRNPESKANRRHKQETQNAKRIGGWESPGEACAFWFYLVDSLAGFWTESQRILFLFLVNCCIHLSR